MVECPVCLKLVAAESINQHLDSGCITDVLKSGHDDTSNPTKSAILPNVFRTPVSKQTRSRFDAPFPATQPSATRAVAETGENTQLSNYEDTGSKRLFSATQIKDRPSNGDSSTAPITKRAKQNNLQKVAPLAERMRPTSLEDVVGQDLIGPSGVIRNLIEEHRIPSMILWGGSGTGKTTIARLVAYRSGCRFVEINSTSSGIAECKRLFAEARNELQLTGRQTIIFCDEIHRFNKTQQDVFLGPVEAGQVILIGATTENPSFKVVNALLSRCRTFVLAKLSEESLVRIMTKAIDKECSARPAAIDDAFLEYLAAFSDGDARIALNLLEMSLDLAQRSSMGADQIKQSLTQTLVYDRSGDQHYDAISAFHKSIRGSDPDAALYYLARMLQSGEDPLYIARRMIVMASEDIGLADNSMLPLVTAAYTAIEKVGLPEAKINLAHAAVALAMAPKSVKAYRALGSVTAALSEPGVAGLPIPIHLRNAPTKLLKELGHGKEYKYPPNFVDGQVIQTYLPDELIGRRFLEDRHLGTEIDPAVEKTQYFFQDDEMKQEANRSDRFYSGRHEGHNSVHSSATEIVEY